MTLRPWVIGPENIEPITSVEDAREAIELAFLSGMAHRDSPVATDVGRALWGALASEQFEHGDLIWDIYMSSVGTAVRSALEMELGNWMPQSDWGKRIYEEGQHAGEAEGLRRGKAEGEAHALLLILKTRGVRLRSAERQRVRSCRDLRQLHAWLRRAVTAETAAEVFGDT